MATEITTTFDINPREIDIAERFARNINAFQQITGTSRMVRKQPGTIIKTKHAKVTDLKDGEIEKGGVVPFSEIEVTETEYDAVKIMKYRKNVKVEDIDEFGYDAAVSMTDDAFIAGIQNKIFDKFFTYLQTGELTTTVQTFQDAVALSQGLVIDKWEQMSRDITEIVGWVNTLDFYEYLGAAQITMQNQFGYNYLKNFMGYGTLFISSRIPRGKVISTPRENLVTYHIDPSNPDFSRAQLGMTTDRTGLIGVKTVGDFSTFESYVSAMYGVTVFAEYQDGIAVITVGEETTPSVTLDKETASINVGGTATLTATTVPAGETVTWTSSDDTVATVSSGTVTGVAAGTATITATITVDETDYTATCAVTVAGA